MDANGTNLTRETEQELERIEALPLAERPAALEALERRLRAALEETHSA